MSYSNIISSFTWSYSRLMAFEHCPYQFFMSYIKPHSKKPLFFSAYGTFLHKIIEKKLKGELQKEELTAYYLTNFQKEVTGRAPNKEIFQSYFNQGLEYLQNMDFPYPTPLAVERRVDFFIGDKPFTGIIDCVAEDEGGIIILDNKSRTLKPRSARKKPTKSDLELDEYLRQLYLYSIPIQTEYHQYPKRLVFNCFRTGNVISEPFQESALENTKCWALQTIEKITNHEDWGPNMEYWKCRYLCDHSHQCEYQLMNGR